MMQHHILIGPPASGKSTFALTLAQHLGNCEIVSTDDIRTQLYGNPTIQGHWPDIFAQVEHRCHGAIAAGKTIVYDATNAKRPWRFSVLRAFLATYPQQTWMGWHLKTPLSSCLTWNRKRDRQVPVTVIEHLYQALEDFPPEPAEGMTIVQKINPRKAFNLQQLLLKSPRKIINHHNATKNSKCSFHPYSDFLHFEQLLYLIKLLIAYPGAGQLRHSQPDRLAEIAGETIDCSSLSSDLDELSLLLSQWDPIYSDPAALVQNLDWLYSNGFLSPASAPNSWTLAEKPPPATPTHGYSERDRFLRLMGTLRFILHHPFYQAEGSALEALTYGLRHHNILRGSFSSCRDTLRKDIQLILKPYGLLQPYRYKQGYFLGTGIFSPAQLLQLHHLLAGQAKSLADPTVLTLFQTLNDRLQASKLSDLNSYPVRALYNFTITNQTYLPSEALAKTIDRLEEEIEAGQCLELQRFAGVGRHGTEPDTFFQAWPVQIVFHNIGWYLGYEVASGSGGSSKGLLAFERLDRLFRGRFVDQHRTRTAQERACQQLQDLFQASGGLFLGQDPRHQRQWLQGDPEQRQALTVLLELWCDDRSFRFISEGDQRFPLAQIQLSPRLPESQRSSDPKIFCLKATGDALHPHRFQVQLPYWALDGVDLQRWVGGFKEQVRVVSPAPWVAKFRHDAEAIGLLYRECKET